jgi:hypothetical protein
MFSDWYKLDENNNVVKINNISEIEKIFGENSKKRIVAQDKNEIWFLSTVFFGIRPQTFW